MFAPLFFEGANVSSQCLDLFLGEFLPVGRHLLLSVSYGIEDALVADFFLPLAVAEISRVFQFALDSFGATVFTMTRGALLCV